MVVEGAGRPLKSAGKARQHEAGGFRRAAGERRYATVLFADIVNSSAVVAGSDPEEANDALLAILQSLADIVHQFGGAVVQILGDGIMALFGAPRAQEDHALMACLAAQTMRESVTQRLGGTAPQRRPVKLRIAIDTGEIVGEVLHAPWWTEYRAVGSAVHRAGKLEKSAPAGGIIVTERTGRLVSGRLRARPHGGQPVQRTAPGEEVLEVLEVQPSRTTAMSLAAQREPFLVGREPDLAVLAAAFEAARCGSGRAVVIRGEAGIGKSRLAYEFLRSLSPDEVLAVECAQLPVGSLVGTNPLAAIVRGVLGLAAAPAEGELREALVELCAPLDEGERAALAALLEVPTAAQYPIWSGLDPLQRWALTVDAIKQVLMAAARTRPLVLLFEDFQWADSRTRAVAKALAESARCGALLLLVTCRPEVEFGADWPATDTVELQPLSRQQLSQLLRAELGEDPALAALQHALMEKSGGNPFFIEESIRDLENSGAIEGARGSKRLVRSEALLVPATVQGVLAARIDRLEPESRRLVLIASVIGHCFDVELLAAAARTSKREALVRLNRLCTLDFVERTRVVPNVEFRFRHALIQEVAYNTLLIRLRRELHAAILEAVERRPAAGLTGRDELLAHHAFHAQRWRSAGRYSQRASQTAQANSRYFESEKYLEQALQAMAHLDEPGVETRRIDILIELARTLSALGRGEDAVRRLCEAEAVAREHADAARLGLAALNRGLVHWICFRLPLAAEAVLEAVEIAGQTGDSHLRAAALARLGGIRVEQGRFSEGYALLADAEAAHAAEERMGRPSLAALAASGRRASMARALGELGRFDEAVAAGDEALLTAENAKHAFSFVYAAVALGAAIIRKGDFARSVPTLERAWELSQRTHCELLKPFCCSALGFAYLRSGAMEQGRALLKQADSYILGPGWQQWPIVSNWIAEADLLLGDTAAAAARAARTIEAAHADTALGEAAWSQLILAEALSRQDPTGAAPAAAYQAALQQAESLAMAPLAARARMGLGRHLARLGRGREAGIRLKEAAAQFSALGMDFWVGEAAGEADFAWSR